MTPELEQQWLELIEKVSRWTAQDFPDVTVDDITGGMWLWLLEHRGVAEEMGPDADGMIPLLMRKAKEVAWAGRKENLQNTSQYTYRPSDVRELLKTVFDKEKWSKAVVPEDARSLKRGADGFEMSIDVRGVVELMGLEDQRVMFEAYALGSPPEAGTAASKRLSRAVGRVTKALNSYARGKSLTPTTSVG